ncbi:MAG TPA: hypothetical protein VGB44_11360 [Flavobacterium sp.]|jgi:uncharacterized protein YacL
MKTTNFLASGFAGGLIYFLLGWLFYGIIFKEQFPEDGDGNMVFIFLGCMSFGFLIAYVNSRWANLVTAIAGAKAGAAIGLFVGLLANFFMRAQTPEVDYQNFILDLVITIIMAAITGAVIALVNGAMSRNRV